MWTQTLGEFIGTFILVLLGDGVVAGVSLNKSQSEWCRLDCHHTRVGLSRDDGRLCRGISRSSPP